MIASTNNSKQSHETENLRHGSNQLPIRWTVILEAKILNETEDF